jgi:hypothetical protein
MSTHAIALGVFHAAPSAAGTGSNQDITWPEVFAFLVLVILVMALIATGLDIWKTKRKLGQESGLRELVNRYEQLASSTMDAQQRTAADVAELRSRAASIEQILRTVE